MRGNQILIAVSTALAIGLLGSASTALANDSGENDMSGFVIPGSMAGVNPAYHPELLGRTTSGRSAYGSAVTPAREHRSAGENDRDR